jgi:glyoxylase-like metal-dependent hydrolase (beta-lactamase superfamily II)
VSTRVFPLPGPFETHRIVELEGAFIPAATLFPAATPELILATAAANDPRLFDRQNQLLVMSFHSIVVRTAHCTILVDSCVGNDKPRPRNPHWHQRQGSYLSDLAAAGLKPEDIDIVMCTHLHADHVGWNTRLDNGRWVPTFPNARYLFGRTEVEHWRQVLTGSPPEQINHGSWADSVEPIFEAGQAVLVAEDQEVDEGVQLLPAPGHTPGNVIVRLEARGERAYLTGDVIHHPIQVEHPEWSTCFCWDPQLSADTRLKTLTTVAQQEAWLLPAHFPTPTATRIRQTDAGFRMEDP